jgi:hypothetical protein
MRELRALLVYITGAVCVVFGLMASADWASDKYHSLSPREAEIHTTAVASKAERADEGTDRDDTSRRPVWIEPTRKYIYNPSHVVSVKPDLAPVAAMPKPQWKQQGAAQGYPPGKTAVKRVRPTFAASGGSRRADASAGQAQQLLILPLQHQAPN